MTVRKVARREVRLDAEHDRQLEQQLRSRDLTFAAWIREQIDRACEDAARARRVRAVEELAAMNIDFGWDPTDPDPATKLIRQAADEATFGRLEGV